MTKPRDGGKKTTTFRLTSDEREAVRAAAEAERRLSTSWLLVAALEAVGHDVEDDGSRATRHDRVVSVTLTADERATFDAEAERHSMSLGEWLRLVALQKLRRI